MDLKTFHDTVRYFANVEQGGWISPPEIDNLAYRAQMWFFNDLVEVYAKSQKLDDALSVFSTKLPFTTPGTGLLVFPTDPNENPCYEHLLSVYNQYFDSASGLTRTIKVKMLLEDTIGERLDSQTLAPTIFEPVGIEEAPGKVQLYPQTALTGYAYYLRRPRPTVYKYTQVGRAVTYDATGSTQFEWNESSMNKILIKTIQMFGVNISDAMLIQYTAQKDQADM